MGKNKNKKKLFAGIALSSVLLGSASVYATTGSPFGSNLVGQQTNGSVLTASNQFITPAGTQTKFHGNPLTTAIRPDGKTAVALTSSGLNILDLKTGQLVATGFSTGLSNMWGMTYSSDGSKLYVAGSNNGKGQINRFGVASDGTLTNQGSIALPDANVGSNINPQDLAITPNGKTLLVALNRDNSVGVIDLQTNKLVTTIPVGNAPTSILMVGNTAYVSNVGGRKANAGDVTNNSSGTQIVADKEGAAATGTVSAIDLSTNTVSQTISVGLQPTRMTSFKNYVFVANANSDTVSVIDIKTNNVVQTIAITPYLGAPKGSQPNAVAMINDHQLVVSLGRNNALAVYDWKGVNGQPRLRGLVPTAWYPVDVKVDPTQKRLLVANADGVGALAGSGTVSYQPGTARTGAQVYKQEGSVSLIPFPANDALAHYTDQVYKDNNWLGSNEANEKARPNMKPVAMPERIGEPSTIKHVFYIIKENRTYDQMLGDIGKGNGDPSLTQFGQKITPNLHQLANTFPLLDNFYTSSIQSASGHQWVTQATNPDYQEKETDNGNVRSYPFNGGDALTYSSTGFLWNDALNHNVSFANFGEYTNKFSGSGSFGSWTDWFNDYLKLSGQQQGDLHAPIGSFQATSDVSSLNTNTYHPFPGFNTAIPDQYRAQLFLDKFKQYVKDNNLPQFVTMTLPDDHTSGLATGMPTPQAAVADNDLAVAKIIDAISHSPYWKDSAIFITEDDSQNGVDHVDGHRQPAYVISPWVKRGIIDSHYGTIINMDRSIEQILGLPPMNQNDMAALPMSEIFTDKPDFTPYNALPTNVPLTTMNGQPGSDKYALEGTAQASSTTQVQAKAQASSTTQVQAEWTDWSNTHKADLGGAHPYPDKANANMMNHAIWYATKGFTTPFPGEKSVLTPDQVKAQPQSKEASPADNY